MYDKLEIAAANIMVLEKVPLLLLIINKVNDF